MHTQTRKHIILGAFQTRQLSSFGNLLHFHWRNFAPSPLVQELERQSTKSISAIQQLAFFLLVCMFKSCFPFGRHGWHKQSKFTFKLEVQMLCFNQFLAMSILKTKSAVNAIVFWIPSRHESYSTAKLWSETFWPTAKKDAFLSLFFLNCAIRVAARCHPRSKTKWSFYKLQPSRANSPLHPLERGKARSYAESYLTLFISLVRGYQMLHIYFGDERRETKIWARRMPTGCLQLPIAYAFNASKIFKCPFKVPLQKSWISWSFFSPDLTSNFLSKYILRQMSW